MSNDSPHPDPRVEAMTAPGKPDNQRDGEERGIEPKPRLKGYNAAYRSKLEHEFFDSEHGSRTDRIPMWMREPISRMLREIENGRAALQSAAPVPAAIAPEARSEAEIAAHLKGIQAEALRERVEELERFVSDREQRAVALLREAISDAAFEWQQYVSEDNAPRNLVEHMEQAFDAAIDAFLGDNHAR